MTANQIREGNADAWDYLGAEQCANYREQVLELWRLGSTEDQIAAWFEGEKGSKQNPYSGEKTPKTVGVGGETAYDDFAAGCGSVSDLLQSLPRVPPPR